MTSRSLSLSLPPHSRDPRHSPIACHGPVQLDDQADDFSGCIRLSNNTGELSAVPQILAFFLLWKERHPREAHRAHLIMVYDSQLTRDACDVPASRRHIPPKTNETVTVLSRRLLQAITDGGSTVEWVKTRGHADKYVKHSLMFFVYLIQLEYLASAVVDYLDVHQTSDGTARLL